MRERGRRCLVMQTDISQEDQVDELVAKTMEEFGRIDIVVNNAATRRDGDVDGDDDTGGVPDDPGHQPDRRIHADAEGGSGDAGAAVGDE